MPKYFEFYAPTKIISGYNAIFNLPNELSNLHAKNPIIITDQGVVGAKLINYVEEAFNDYGLKMPFVFSDVPENSSDIVVKKIMDIYKNKECDGIIAIGGGSVIDTSKGVNMLVSENGCDLREIMGVDILRKTPKPLIAIPTTTGTGSEVTGVAVIYDTQKMVKMSYASERLIPNIAILDPKLTLSLPKRLTATSGMDALTHAIEAFISIQKNPISDSFSLKAIEIISKNLVKVIKKPNDVDLRFNMINAATMAGIAFSNSMVGVVHSLGHALGSLLHIPHGIAMFVLLPAGLRFLKDEIRDELSFMLLSFSEEEYMKTPKEQRAEKFIELIEDLRLQLNELSKLPLTLSELGVREKHLNEISKLAINDGSSIFSKKEISLDDAYKLLKEVL